MIGDLSSEGNVEYYMNLYAYVMTEFNVGFYLCLTLAQQLFFFIICLTLTRKWKSVANDRCPIFAYS